MGFINQQTHVSRLEAPSRRRFRKTSGRFYQDDFIRTILSIATWQGIHGPSWTKKGALQLPDLVPSGKLT